MATYRPKLGYSAWEVPATPVKEKIDWQKIGAWVGLTVFCLVVWAGVIMLCAKAL